MGDEEKTRDELIKELENSRRQLRELRATMVVEEAPIAEVSPEKVSRPESPREGTNGRDFSEGTQSIDLSGLFTRHVSTSGSFHAKGIGETLFGKLLEALPIPALLVDGLLLVRFANQACKRIDEDYNATVGKPFAGLFESGKAGKGVESLSQSVFDTRKPRYCIAMLKINDGRIWGRVTLRSVRVGRDRFILALVEDLTAEKKQLLLKEKLSDELREEFTRRLRAEKKQMLTEHRLELAMKGADLAWWDLNVQTGSVICDRSFSEMLGYSADEILPEKNSWEQMLHGDDMPRFSQALDAHFEGLSPLFEVEHRVRTKSGDWKWVLTRGRVVERGEEGQPLRAAGTNLDITVAKEAQEKIDALTYALIQTQERERERISLDLHDQVAQDLSSLRLSLDTLLDELRSVAPDLSDRAEEISKTVKGVVQAIRDISYELRPPGLDQLGLVNTVQHYCSEFSKKHRLSVEFVPMGLESPALDFDTQINLFRVIQESLNNIAKHAGAQKVAVHLTGSPSRIVLRIEDDGKGFDVKRESAAAIEDKRMGLWCMQQRIGLLQGKMDVVSSAESGTDIRAEVPLGG